MGAALQHLRVIALTNARGQARGVTRGRRHAADGGEGGSKKIGVEARARGPCDTFIRVMLPALESRGWNAAMTSKTVELAIFWLPLIAGVLLGGLAGNAW
jgi:hypothetical protein